MEKYSSKKIIDAAIGELQRATRLREGELFELIEQFILSLDAKGGNVLRNSANILQIAGFEELFLEWLIESGFAKDIKKHMGTREEIANNVTRFHKDVNDIKVSQKIITDANRVITARVARDMLGAGITANVTRELQDVLYSNVQGGGSLKDILQAVEELAVSTAEQQGLLTRYTTQVSRDLLSGYKGALHDEVRNKYKLDAYIYINSVVKNTRAQCKRWRKKRILLISELQDEINWAMKNGSGMRKGTTPANFAERRGGYSCRHEALPTRSQK